VGVGPSVGAGVGTEVKVGVGLGVVAEHAPSRTDKARRTRRTGRRTARAFWQRPTRCPFLHHLAPWAFTRVR
jgi:hypothetical protein